LLTAQVEFMHPVFRGRIGGSAASMRNIFRSRGSADPNDHIGQGIASLVFDAAADGYHCYWLVGPSADHLIEQAQVATASEAVSWAAARTPRARLRSPDHQTRWAGTDPTPGGFAGTWQPGPVTPEGS
jgi:hypothetical protein